jgi:sugar lactone lactonase YvrE
VRFRLSVVRFDGVGGAVYFFEVTQKVVVEDASENDNTMESAKPLLVNATQVHSLYPAGDQDWYSFALHEPRTVIVDTGVYHSEGPPQLNLFDSSGEPLADEFGFPMDFRSSYLRASLQPGDYFLRASALEMGSIANNVIVETYPITLQYDEDTYEPDPLELDYYSPDSVPITLRMLEGQSYARFLSPIGKDVDYFLLALSQNSNVTILVEDFPGTLSVGLKSVDVSSGFIDRSVAVLVVQDGLGVSVTAPLFSGLYILELTTDDALDAPFAPYLISYTSEALQLMPDAQEPNDWEGQAYPTSTGQLIDATLHAPDDVDWYEFTLVESSVINVLLDGVDTSAALSGQDFEEIGTIYANVETPGAFYLPPGDYFLAVNWLSSNVAQAGDYTILIVPEPYEAPDDPTEPNNQPEFAVPLTPNASQSHVFGTSTDLVDVFSVEVPDTMRLTVEIASDAGGELSIDLTDASGEFLGFGWYSECVTDSLSVVLGPGTYFLEVEPDSGPILTYGIMARLDQSYENGDEFEPDNSYDAATELAESSPQSHTIMPRTDEDWMYFELDAAGVAEFSVSSSVELAPLFVELYDESLQRIRLQDESDGSFKLPLTPGRYYARVIGDEEIEVPEYTISLSLEYITEPAIELVVDPIEHVSVTVDDDLSLYTFEVSQESTFYLGIPLHDGDGLLSLFGSSGVVFSQRRASVVTLAPGMYTLLAESMASLGGMHFTLGPLRLDSFEPDNEREAASPLELDVTHGPHTLAPVNDEDWFQFVLTYPGQVVVEADGADYGLCLELLDSDLNRLSYGPAIRHELIQGQYYVRVALPAVALVAPVYQLQLQVLPAISTLATYRFQRLSPTLQQPWYFSLPTDVDVAESGDVYLADTFGHRVVHLTASGQVIRSWGQVGVGLGQFLFPAGLAVERSGRVFVTDSANRVQRFSGDGEFETQWGGPGALPGEFRFDDYYVVSGDEAEVEIFLGPAGIAVDSAEQVYVCDVGNKRIQVFDGEGNFVRAWSVNFPSAIAVSADDRVYVGDTQLETIGIYSSFGEKLDEFNTMGVVNRIDDGPYGIAIRADGFVAVSHAGSEYPGVVLFDQRGAVVSTNTLLRSSSTVLQNVSVPQPAGLAFDAIQGLNIANSGVSRLSPFGVPLGDWHSHGNQEGYFLSPRDIAVDNSGAFYVVESGNDSVQRVLPDGTADFLISSQNMESVTSNEIFRIEIDGDTLYAITAQGILHSDLDGVVNDMIPLPGASALAIGLDGTRFVLFAAAGTVVRYNKNFARLNSWTWSPGDFVGSILILR